MNLCAARRGPATWRPGSWKTTGHRSGPGSSVHRGARTDCQRFAKLWGAPGRDGPARVTQTRSERPNSWDCDPSGVWGAFGEGLRFLGLKSRWTSPAACAAARPSPAWSSAARISRQPRGLAVSQPRSVWPSISSIATNTRSSATPTS